VDVGFERLLSEAADYKRSAFAESTKATYRSHLNSYLRFCLYFSKVPVPAEQVTLKAYVAFLARSIKSTGINSYLNIVRILHLEAGLANPLTDNFELNMVKRGVARQLGSPPVQKLPLDMGIIHKLFKVYDFSSPHDIAFWAALMVGFFGLLRKSTLLLQAASSKPDSCLIRGDVVNVNGDSFVLIV
jgi:hypothetical protein